MFAISLVSLFGYHCFLVMVNRSTLEAFRPPIFRTGPDKHGFSLGHQANIAEVFGDNRRLWLVPVFTSLGDGITFPQKMVDEDTDGLLNQRQRWAETDEEAGHSDEGMPARISGAEKMHIPDGDHPV
uniref:Putative palmitoyltransferase zdhhc15 n=1 Tax=Amblyomma triste TaxID=251400 RepID=A0A023G7A8_AMBTT